MAIVKELANGMIENPIEVDQEVQKDDQKTNNENVKLLKCRRYKFTTESIRQLVKHTKRKHACHASARNSK